jgi:hypothetical protein
MIHAIEMGWFILHKYYELTDRFPVYAAAILLDPRKRTAYIEQNWPEEWHRTALDNANTLWEAEYKDLPLESSDPDFIDVETRSEASPEPIKDEFAQYLRNLAVPVPSYEDTDNLKHFIT